MPRKFFATRKAPRTPFYKRLTRAITQNNDIQKTAYYRPKHKNQKINHKSYEVGPRKFKVNQ